MLEGTINFDYSKQTNKNEIKISVYGLGWKICRSPHETNSSKLKFRLLWDYIKHQCVEVYLTNSSNQKNLKV